MPQAIFDLTKRIEPGTWRYIGQRLEGIDLSEIPIAGTNIYEIYQMLGGQVYAVGGANVANAFVVERPPLRLLYVRPGYTGYRRLGLKVLSRSTWKVDFDHALGQREALECIPLISCHSGSSHDESQGKSLSSPPLQ